MIRPTKRALSESVGRWLLNYLHQKYPRHKVVLLPDTAHQRISRVLSKSKFHSSFPQSGYWDVLVTSAAIVHLGRHHDIIFAHMKMGELTVSDVGRYLACCRICRPLDALLLSSQGLSSNLVSLLKVYGRLDVLEYGTGKIQRSIRIAVWDVKNETIDWGSLIPPGDLESHG
jgi:hypothetical protein